MNIFNKRPLGLILCILLGGFSIFATLSERFRVAVLLLSSAFCIAAFVIKCFRKNNLIKIASVVLLLSFALSWIYFECVFYPKKYYDEEASFTAEIIDSEKYSDYYQSLDAKIETVNGKKSSYKIKINLYGDFDIVLPGSCIEFKAKLREFEADDGFDFKSYNTSRGFSACTEVAAP